MSVGAVAQLVARARRRQVEQQADWQRFLELPVSAVVSYLACNGWTLHRTVEGRFTQWFNEASAKRWLTVPTDPELGDYRLRMDEIYEALRDQPEASR